MGDAGQRCRSVPRCWPILHTDGRVPEHPNRPSGGGPAAPEAAHFEWLGLTLYRPDSGGGTAWLYDAARPVDGRLLRQDTGRLVLGRVAFRVPKTPARPATNMLLYLTFDRKLIALHIL